MLKIKLVQPIHLPYDFSGGWFKILLLSTWFGLTAFFLFQGIGELWWNILSLLGLYFGLYLISTRYGLWIKNYREEGSLELYPNLLKLKTSEREYQILFADLKKIEIITNFYQNYRQDLQGREFDGLGKMVFHGSLGEKETLYFLLQNAYDWAKFQSITDQWNLASHQLPATDNALVLLKAG